MPPAFLHDTFPARINGDENVNYLNADNNFRYFNAVYSLDLGKKL